MLLLGPIQRLRFWSTLCPYFVSEEEQAMRNADMILQSVPVRWYRRVQILPSGTKDRHKQTSLLDAMNDLSCFGGDNKGVDTSYNTNDISTDIEDYDNDHDDFLEAEDEPKYTPYIGIDATINVIDTKEGPALEIISNQYTFVDYDYEPHNDVYSNTLQQQSSNNTKSNTNNDTMDCMTMKKVILFKHMHLTTIGDDEEWETITGIPNINKNNINNISNNRGFMIYAKKNHILNYDKMGNIIDYDNIHQKEQFVWNTDNDDDDDTLSDIHSIAMNPHTTTNMTRVLACQLLPNSKLSLSREEAIKHLNTLIHWDKIDPTKRKYNHADFFSNNFNTTTTTNNNKNNKEGVQKNNSSSRTPSTSPSTVFPDDENSNNNTKNVDTHNKQQKQEKGLVTTASSAIKNAKLARKPKSSVAMTKATSTEIKKYPSFTPTLLQEEPRTSSFDASIFSGGNKSTTSSKETLRRKNPLISWDKTAIHEQQINSPNNNIIKKKKRRNKRNKYATQRSRSVSSTDATPRRSDGNDPPLRIINAHAFQGKENIRTITATTTNNNSTPSKRNKRKKSLKQIQSILSCVVPYDHDQDYASSEVSTSVDILKDLDAPKRMINSSNIDFLINNNNSNTNVYDSQSDKYIIEVD
mmetsp:Transcript_28981/g.33134  ORF Transcript_28981/g.33134 Transcript_28981/m.33134 type:complete len:637 (-) Transcript_28981:241-2151(-)